VELSSNEGALVLDCFCGSGTTAAVAEKLNRRWIACDLGRFAIHTTRKRLLGIPDVKPFIVQNLGKYERQQWQVAEFPANGKDRLAEQKEREDAYRKFILELYHATPFPCLTRGGAVHGTDPIFISAPRVAAPNSAANAWLVNLTKPAGRNPIQHGKRSTLERVSPLFPDTSLQALHSKTANINPRQPQHSHRSNGAQSSQTYNQIVNIPSNENPRFAQFHDTPKTNFIFFAVSSPVLILL
jgi:hypothetical protein